MELWWSGARVPLAETQVLCQSSCDHRKIAPHRVCNSSGLWGLFVASGGGQRLKKRHVGVCRDHTERHNVTWQPASIVLTTAVGVMLHASFLIAFLRTATVGVCTPVICY